VEAMRVLNLYAGVGGNRKLWENVRVTAVESDPAISALYQRLNPDDEVFTCDAHQWLLDHQDYDFVWSSPPCQTHSRMQKGTRHKSRRYPDMTLYQEILFLQNFFKGKWVVENVVPYYAPLIPPTAKVGRHLFWANFPISAKEIPQPRNFINRCNMAGKKAMQEWLGINFEETIYYGDNHCPAQILRNCVHPELGLQILNCAK
jgi:DNA (cytosine-5)-methyltransferase 1